MLAVPSQRVNCAFSEQEASRTMFGLSMFVGGVGDGAEVNLA